MKLNGCNALVTGASAGIGSEFARQLGEHANSIVLVARRGDKLEALRDELAQRHPNLAIHVRAVDLTKASEIGALLDWLNQENLCIDLLINNAGLGDLGPFISGSAERVEEILRVNIFALTTLTRALVPAMVARKRGAILNVSSSAGFMPIANFSVYAASKAYVTSFSEGLRAELRGTGVSVTALCPGPVHTEFSKVAQRSSEPSNASGPAIIYVSAADVARTGLQGVERDRALVIPGVFMKLAMAIVRMMPMPVLRFASGLSAKRVPS